MLKLCRVSKVKVFFLVLVAILEKGKILFSFYVTSWRELTRMAGFYAFKSNISFTFQAVKSLSAVPIPLIYVLGNFVNILVIF